MYIITQTFLVVAYGYEIIDINDVGDLLFMKMWFHDFRSQLSNIIKYIPIPVHNITKRDNHFLMSILYLYQTMELVSFHELHSLSLHSYSFL